MRYVKLLFALTFMGFLSIATAGEKAPNFSQIKLQISAQEWVNTRTAEVMVSVNATQNQAGLMQLQQLVLQDLNKLAQADWHIIAFNRIQDPSGLERVVLNAKARLNQDQLGGLRDQANALSLPGKKFEITDIDYAPSFSELNAANRKLREKLYQDAKAELDIIKKAFPSRQYYLHDITLYAQSAIVPQPAMRPMMVKISGDNNGMNISDQLQMTADVVFVASLDNSSS